MRQILWAAAFAALVGAQAAAAEDGPLVGKPLPELQISHPVSGEAWTQADLLGSVVVLDLFYVG